MSTARSYKKTFAAVATPHQGLSQLRKDFVDVLMQRPKATLMSHMYDQPHGSQDLTRGAELWREIYQNTPSYYLGHEEKRLLKQQGKSIAKHLNGEITFVDLGPGSAESVRDKSLPILCEIENLAGYCPIDVCGRYIDEAIGEVRQHKSDINFSFINGDFYSQFNLDFHSKHTVAFFSGSTIGNVADDLLKPENDIVIQKLEALQKLLGKNGILIITQDTNQDIDSLMAAYNNPNMEKFTLNVLHRVKRDLDIKDFDVTAFKFHVEWHPVETFVGRYAIATKKQEVVFSQHKFTIHKGQKLNIVRSYKYSAHTFQEMAKSAGFKTLGFYLGENNRMAIHVLATDPIATRPANRIY